MFTLLFLILFFSFRSLRESGRTSYKAVLFVHKDGNPALRPLMRLVISRDRSGWQCFGGDVGKLFFTRTRSPRRNGFEEFGDIGVEVGGEGGGEDL